MLSRERERERRLEVTGKRRRKQLLDDLKEKRRYCKFEEVALEHTLWRTHFGKAYGPVVGQSTQL